MTTTLDHTATTPAAPARSGLKGWLQHPTLAKVPEITAIFWIVKLLTTGMGEAASDAMAGVNVPMAAGIGFVGLLAALWLQLRTDRYRPWTYWFAVAMVAVVGTMGADVVHLVGIPYPISTAVCAVALLAVLFVWHRVEGTLDMHSITTGRREVFYWLTVLATFALGTAAGDFTAIALDWGYLQSAFLFAGLMVLLFVAWRMGLGQVAAFWTAYALTRPLGASLADWMGKPAEKGHGLGWGDGPVALVALVFIVGAVAWLARTGHGVQQEH